MTIASSSESKWIPALWTVAAIVGLAVAWSLWNVSPAASTATDVAGSGTVSRPPARTAQPVPAAEALPVESADAKRDAELKAQLVGFWFHSESGEHWIENRADGTSRMLLKLDFVASLLYGQETAMDLTWEIKDGILSHTVVSGSPQPNVDSLIKAFGKTRAYSILETTPERMLLESRNEKKKKDLWTRSPAPKEWAEKQPQAAPKRSSS